MGRTPTEQNEPTGEETAQHMPEGPVPLTCSGAVNVVALMPCPLKVRFKADFSPFLGAMNETWPQQIYCPNIVEGDAPEHTDPFAGITDVDQMPDLIVTANLGTVFSESFRRRYLESGVYEGITNPAAVNALPGAYKTLTTERNIGFIAFGAWSAVTDLSLSYGGTYPRSWNDLTLPEFCGLIATPGQQNEFCGGNVLRLLRERAGMDGVRRFAGNVKTVKHFSEIAKSLDSSDPDRVPFILLPNAVVAQIPSRKKVAFIEFKDGPLLMPVLMFVKAGRYDACRPVIEYFWSDRFQAAIAPGDFHLPERMDWKSPFSFPSWDTLLQEDYPTVTETLTGEFFKWFRPGGRQAAE